MGAGAVRSFNQASSLHQMPVSLIGVAISTAFFPKLTEELGKGDIAIGTVAAFEAGILDIPFAPNKYNAGKVLPARDNDGAIRILEMGNLPLTKEIKDFHRAKLEERAKFENRQVSLQMVIDDVSAIEKGRLVGRP
jgi:methylaspartate mutase epsilon subunit